MRQHSQEEEPAGSAVSMDPTLKETGQDGCLQSKHKVTLLLKVQAEDCLHGLEHVVRHTQEVLHLPQGDVTQNGYVP